MPVKSTYIKKNQSQAVVSLLPFDFYFTEVQLIEIPKTVHGKDTVLHVQAYDEEDVLIHPPIKVDSALTIYVQSTIPFSGKIRII